MQFRSLAHNGSQINAVKYMKRQILEIADDLSNDAITVEQAQDLLLRLFGVSKSFAEGVKVKIIANTRGHEFDIGEVVTIGIQDNDMWLAHGEKASWWIAEHEANVC